MPTRRVILIEPNPAAGPDIIAALSYVRARKYTVSRTPSLDAGLKALNADHDRRSAAIILDLQLPDSSGLATFLRLQSQSSTAPILILIDRAHEDLAAEAVKRGALDYLIREELTPNLLDKALRLAFERTHTVLALRASEARYRTMFESSAAGVYQASCDDRLITVNPAFIRMLGYATEAEVLALEVGRDIFASAEDHATWRRELEEENETKSRETTLRTRKGERLVVMHNARLVRDSRNAPLYYEGTITDVTAAHQQARQWSYEASHDPLTGLVNRRELERRLETMLENALIDRSTLALLVIDLDGFKDINDKHGHVAGDDVLRHVAGVLKGNARGGDLIARLGGDEFVMVLEHCAESEATRIGEKVLTALSSEPCLWAGQALAVRASIGVALSSPSDPAWTTLVEHADLACYEAKGKGGSQVRPYRGDGTAIIRLSKARRLATAAEEALETQKLRLAARPIVPLQDRVGSRTQSFSPGCRAWSVNSSSAPILRASPRRNRPSRSASIAGPSRPRCAGSPRITVGRSASGVGSSICRRGRWRTLRCWRIWRSSCASRKHRRRALGSRLMRARLTSISRRRARCFRGCGSWGLSAVWTVLVAEFPRSLI